MSFVLTVAAGLQWIAEVLNFLNRQHQVTELDLRPLVATFKTARKLM
jgi:hypothetical protein